MTVGPDRDNECVPRRQAGESPEGFLSLSDRVQWIPRGCRWVWNGVRFGAVGGAFSVDWRRRTPGDSWWPDHENVSDTDIERLGSDALDENLRNQRLVNFDDEWP